MRTTIVKDFAEWRQAARSLLCQNIAPSDVVFRSHAEQSLFGWEEQDNDASNKKQNDKTIHIPKQFLESAKLASYFRHERVWNLLYSLIWRITHDEPALLEDATDDQVRDFQRICKAVSRDAHKMKAFVRFRRIADADGERFVAWHRPDHLVLRHVVPFFARRFTDMNWTIFTPDESASWDGEQLTFGEGVPASAVTHEDKLEDLWRTYYRSIFNPVRIKLKMMRREMPVRHWATLPETQIMPEMLAEAPQRVNAMFRHARPRATTVAELLPIIRDLPSLTAAAEHCQACDLCERATQTVFGRGSTTAKLMLVGEQPGDEEDRQGEPFIGPAGRLLRQAIAEVGIDWEELYVTNAVKHFHWTPRGKIRLHKQPPARALSACQDWLNAEAEIIQPHVIVCLGVTAAKAVLGRDSHYLSERGKITTCDLAPRALMTWHPSAILRATSDKLREEMYDDLLAHLRQAEAAATKVNDFTSS